MFGTLDHVGVIVRDLDAAVAAACESLGLEVARSADLPEWGIRARFLGEGKGNLEIFTFDDPEVLEPRLAGVDRRTDHVAFRVDDLESLAATLRATGVRFCGPDRGEDALEPIPTGPAHALWTRPETSGGAGLQFIQPPRD
ncbi:MAG TPA: VOC family protein [Solirubrobacteraceae bacterium]|nr:VOC family protein [Solirubrobacteraceae bacterium]